MHNPQNTKHNQQSIHPVFCVARTTTVQHIILSTKKMIQLHLHTHTKPHLYFLGTPNKTNPLPPPRIYLPRAHPAKHITQPPKYPSSFPCRADNHRPPYYFVNEKKMIQLHIHTHTKPPLYFSGTPNKTNPLPPPRIYLPRAHPTKHKTQPPKYPSSFPCHADNHRAPYYFVNEKNDPVTHTYTLKAPTLFFRYTEQDRPPPSSTNLLTVCSSNRKQNTTTKVSIQFSVSRGQPPSTVLFCQRKKMIQLHLHTHTKPHLYFFRCTEQDQPPPSSTNLLTACTSDKTQNTTAGIHPFFHVARTTTVHRIILSTKKMIQLHIQTHTKPPLFFLGTPNKTNPLPPPRICFFQRISFETGTKRISLAVLDSLLLTLSYWGEGRGRRGFVGPPVTVLAQTPQTYHQSWKQ